MENKEILKDENLKQVNGGQAVLPLLSTERPEEVPEQAVTAEVIRRTCPNKSCGASHIFPKSQEGKPVTCSVCGTVFIP